MTTAMTIGAVEAKAAVVDNSNPFSKATFAEWIEFCDVQPATQKTYNKAVENFAAFLVAADITQPARRDIENYRDALIGSGNYKVSSVRLYLVVVKKFFKYLASKMIYPNVADGVKLPKIENVDEHAHDALELEEAQAAILSFNGTDEKTLRDKCIMSLMIGCGLRSIEVVRMDIGDFEKRKGQWFVNVQGKGRRGKGESVPVSPAIKKLVDEYISVRPKGNKGTALFISTANRNRGARLETQSISRLAKRVFKSIGIESNRVTCHSCRATFATLALSAGVPIRKVAKILRHRSTDTTEIYANDISKFGNDGVQVVSNLIFVKE